MNATHPRFSVRGIQEHEEAHRPANPINVGEIERWTSAIGGTLLVTQGLRRPSPINIALALLGGGLLYRGITGHCGAYQALQIDTSGKHRSAETDHIHQGTLARHQVTVNRPVGELYGYWKQVSNAPRFMINIESVAELGENRSHWVALGPFGTKVSWDSEVINDQPDRLLAWKSLPGSQIDQAGSVRFEPASGGRGTVVTLEQSVEIPAGIIGLTVAKLMGEDPQFQVRESLRHFKQLMETGEIPTTQGQSSGRNSNRQIAAPMPQGV